MEQYYRKVQEKLMVQRDVINSLLKDPRIIGDYYEAIVRDAVREAVSGSFAVGRGVVLDTDGRASRECDIIVYNAVEYGPLFSSGDIAVVNPESVRCVIQVKGTVTMDNLGDAIQSLAAVDHLRSGIWKFIVGFKTNVEYQTLVDMCARSRSVNGVFLFSSNYKGEKEDISLQMQKFVGILKSITAPGVYQTNDAGRYVVLEIGGRDSFQGVPFPEEDAQ
ncbi:MAG: hypothetical protein FWF18_03720 [Dehalococcoidia bacterium]|nr:hypothetical protein [Dehalococcoidia bacterium]